MGSKPAKPAPAPSPSPAPKPAAPAGGPPAATNTVASNPQFPLLLQDFGQVITMISSTSTKDKHYFIAIVPLPDNKGIECAAARGDGDVYINSFSETELNQKKTEKIPWPNFFKALKSNAKSTIPKEVADTLVLNIPLEGKIQTTFQLKSGGKDFSIIHRLFLNNLMISFLQFKGGEADAKFTRLEIEATTKRIEIAELEQRVLALQVEIDPFSKNARGALDDARAAKEQCDGVRKRLRQLRNAMAGDIDILYPDGPAMYMLHTPQSVEHTPHVIPYNPKVLYAIRQKYSEAGGAAPADTGGNCDEVMHVLSKIDDWDYDVFALEKATKGGALFTTAYCLLHKYGLVKHFNMDETILINFLQAVQSGYHPNAYHNATHAADVLHITHYIVESGGLKTAIKMTQQDCLASLLAAAIHDYDHPGFNNNFHIRTGAYLATLYNDRSVLENHHLAQVFDLVKTPKYNVFSSLTWEQMKDVRDTMLEMVLATDMGMHAKIYQNFRRRLNEEKDWATRDDQRLAMNIAIKMSDISNCCRPPALYSAWAQNIAAEFYNQGDTEARLSLPISPFMDRRKDKVDFPKGQISFMNYIVIPLFEAGASLLPNMDFAVKQAQANKQNWLSKT